MKLKSPYDHKNLEDLRKRYFDYNTVYNTPEGKRVLDDLLYYTSIDRTAFCQKSDIQTFFNLGKQAMGYHINAVMNEPFDQPITTTTKEDDYGF